MLQSFLFHIGPCGETVFILSVFTAGIYFGVTG